MVEVGRVTAVIDGDISALKSKLEQGKSAALATAKEIEGKPIKIQAHVDTSSVSGGLSSFMSGEKGKFANVGKELGQSLKQGMEQQFGAMGGMASSVAGALGPAGMIAGAAIAGGAVIASAAVNAARAWETLMSGVGKTAGLSKGTAEFNALSESLLQLSKTAGMGTQESLSTIAQKAGSQGIGARAADAGNYALQREQILAYTKDVQGMATAFDMTAEDSATMGAAVQKSFKLPMDEIHHMGSMVTTVGDSIGVEEKNILEFLSRAGGSKVATNEGVTKTAAFGAALMSTGMQAEVAASSITMLESQVLSNDSKMTTWAKTLGVTKDQLWQMTKTDFYGTVLKTGDLMSKMDISKSIPLGTEIFGAEVAKYINKMGGVGEDYYMGIEKGNAAFEEGTRLAEIFGEKGATIDSKWQAFSNTMNTAFVHLGNTALPVIGDIIDAMSGAVSGADDFGQKVGKLIDIATGKAQKDTGLTGGGAGFTTEKGGLLDRLGLGGEWIIGDEEGNIRRKTAEELQAVLPTMTDTMDGTMNTAGDMAGTVYGDALGAALKTRIPKAVSDGYLAAAGLGKTSAAAAGKATAEDFVKAQETYIKSHSSGGYSSQTMANMAEQQTNDAGPKYLYAAKKDVLASTAYLGLENYSVIQSKIKTDTGGWLQIIDEAGNKIKSVRYISDNQKEELKQGLIESIEPAFMDMPKYMRGVKSEVSGALASILSDGVVEFTEKNQLMDYIKSLDAFQNKFPIEFEAQGLGKIRDDLFKTAHGIPLTLDMGGVEANFALWLTEKKDLFEKIFSTTKQVPLEEEQRTRQKWELANEGSDSMKWLDLMTAAATSGDAGEISAAYDYKVALEALSPELINQKWYYQLLQTLQTEFSSQVKISGGNLALLDQSGKSLGGTFLITDNAAKILAPDFLRLSSATQTATSSLLSAGVQLSNAASQWVASRASDNAKNNAFSGYYNQPGSVGLTGFNAAKPSAINDFGGMAVAGKMGFPKLAAGGKISPGNGGLAMIGEGGETEYVIPESLLTAGSKGAKASSLSGVRGSQGLSDSWNAIYDNAGTCIAFVEPDPSLRFTPASQKAARFDADSWAAVYDDAGTCISYVRPDKSLKFTPGKATPQKLDKSAWNAVYDNKGTCIAYVEPDSSLKFTPANDNGAYGASAQYPGGLGSVAPLANIGSKSLVGGGMPAGALVTGLSKEGYVVSYDPRTDTCEGLSFVAPDPSLKTSDPFYLGLTQNSPAGVSWEEGGWGGQVATALTPELAALQNEMRKSTIENKKTSLNTEQVADNTAFMGLAMGSMVSGALVSGGGGGMSGTTSSSEALNKSGSFGGRYGSLFNDWYTGGVAGLTASHNANGSNEVDPVALLNAAAKRIGGPGALNVSRSYDDGGSYGGWVPSFAEEGYVSSPTLAMIGDRPGGEYVVGANRFNDAAEKMGSGVSITINSPITIQGGGDASAFDASLERRNKELVDQITEQISVARRGR